MSAAATPTPAQVAAAIAEASYWIRGTQISFATWYGICLWDWLTSLPKEHRLIHKSKWSVIKVLYLLCRYWTLLGVPWLLWCFIEDHSQETCNKIFRSPEAIAMWNQIWAESVLLVRTYAFWGQRWYMLVFFVVSLCGVAAFQLWVIAVGMAPLPFINPPTGPCFPTVTYEGSSLIMGFFLAPLMFDTMLTTLTLVRALQLRRQTVGNTSSLMNTFVREGVFYFVLIAAANLVNGIFYFQPKAVMSALNIPLSVMFPDILACRLILDLRERGKALSSSNRRPSYSHSIHRIGLNLSGPPTSNKTHGSGTGGGGGPTAVAGGAITQMGFNHELTTFNTESKGGRVITILTPAENDDGDDDDAPSVYESEVHVKDLRKLPYGAGNGAGQKLEVAAAAAHHRKGSGVRVDIESREFYEEVKLGGSGEKEKEKDDDDEEKHGKGQSFNP